MARKLKAKREGDLIFLPKYVNAEMLMLEYFRDKQQGVEIYPGNDLGKYNTISFAFPDSVHFLDGLVEYINLNI